MAKKSRQQLDLEARDEQRTGANKKKWHVHDLNSITPKTYTQEELFRLWNDNKHLTAIGYPGTGKSLLCLYLALRDVLDPSTHYKRVVIVRSAVQSREIGFTSGSYEEKAALYETPYRNLCDRLLPYAKSYDNLTKAGYIRFETTSFLRGLTFDEGSIILFDECQSATFAEQYTVVSRTGDDSRLVLIGDKGQIDLTKKNDKSGIHCLLQVTEKMDSFDHVRFSVHDIQRNNMIKEFIQVKEEMGL